MSESVGGSVSIQFTADRSQVDAYLASLRNQPITVPVSFTPGIQPATPGSVTGQPARPATFATAGQPGVAPFSFSTGSQGGGFAMGLGSAGPLGSGVQQLNQAAAALTQAAGQLQASAAANMQAANTRGMSPLTGQSVPGRSAPVLPGMASVTGQQIDTEPQPRMTPATMRASYSGRGNRFLGLRTRGLTRYLGYGFMALEAGHLLAANQEAEIQSNIAQSHGDPMALYDQEMSIAKSVEDIPLAGPLLGAAFYNQNAAARYAGDEAKESVRDVQASVQRVTENNTARSQISSINRQTSIFGIRGTIQRRAAGILAESDDRWENYRTQLANMNLRASTENDPYERQRQQKEVARYNQDEVQRLTAQDQHSIAQAHELYRQRDLTASAMRRQSPELIVGAEGMFGKQAELAQVRERQDMVAKAYEQDPKVLGPAADRMAQYMERIQRERLNANIQRRDIGTHYTEQLITRNPLGASLGRIHEEADYAATHESRSAADTASIRRNEAAQSAYTRQEYQDQMNRARVGIRSETQRLMIENDTRFSPGVSAMRSEAWGVSNEAYQAALGAFQSGRGSLVPDIFARGRQQEIRLGQNYLRQFSATEVDPSRQQISGAGAEDSTEVLKQINDNIKALSNIPKKIDDLLTTLGGLISQ